MTNKLIAAAVGLADIIGQENQALRAMDLACACALLGDKNAAADRFIAAQPIGTQAAGLDPGALLTLTARLRELVAENRTLLERAMAVQGRVIGIVTQAGRLAAAREPPRYGPQGRPTAALAVPLALSARA